VNTSLHFIILVQDNAQLIVVDLGELELVHRQQTNDTSIKLIIRVTHVIIEIR